MAQIKFTKFGKVFINQSNYSNSNQDLGYYMNGMNATEAQNILNSSKDIYGNNGSSFFANGVQSTNWGFYINMGDSFKPQMITNICVKQYKDSNIRGAYSDALMTRTDNGMVFYQTMIGVGEGNTSSTDNTYSLDNWCSSEDCTITGNMTNFGVNITISNKRNTDLSIRELGHIVWGRSYNTPSNSQSAADTVTAIQAAIPNSTVTATGLINQGYSTSDYNTVCSTGFLVWRAVLDSPVVIPAGERRVISVDLTLDI
ncbi:MAG: hypothetical protein II393_02370 [Cytophagales bacterium]|nr:hypothetical protein [Cytophagales bacterium]